VGRIGTHLQRERNINQLAPGTKQATFNPGGRYRSGAPTTSRV
jgi:hypothetical protein